MARELVLRNQKLIRLRDDLPCGIELKEFAAKPVAHEDLRQLFTAWGFKTLLHDLDRNQARQSELFGEEKEMFS